MDFLDTLIPADEKDAISQHLYDWAKRMGPTSPSPYNSPPATPAAAAPSAPAQPAQPSVATVAPVGPAPPAPAPGAPPAAVAVGPAAAAPSNPRAMPSSPPMQPINLGPQAQPLPPAAQTLAASKPPELHGWKKVLDIAGQVKMPALEAAIPGTPGNYRQQQRPLLEKQAEEEAKSISGTLAGQKDAATIARDTAEAAHLDQETKNLQNPPAKNKPIQIKGPTGEPLPALQNQETGVITDQNGTPIPNAEEWKPTKPAEKILGHTVDELKGEMAANPALYPGGYMEGAAGFKNTKAAAMALDKAKADADRGPKDTSTRDAARGDRSYNFNAKELDTERKPLEATMAKISAATSNIDLKSPQADALLAPQILSLSAGGAGSGLRMNEAEIARILGGRTVWETLKASANKWSTDPSHPQIPEEQRGQMVAILQAAAQKGTLKSSILEWADGALVNTDDVKEQRQTVATARKLLNAVDEGKRIERNKTTGEFRIAGEQTTPAAQPKPAAAGPAPKTITIKPNEY